MSAVFGGLPTSRGVSRDFRNNNINNVTTNRIPFYPTSNQPPPAPANKGQIIYDTTLNSFCYCNGTSWVCLSAATATSVGVVDCTVGSAGNANAQYNSVQAALDAGCRFIRILDGLTGGQVPGYVEPGPIDFATGAAPALIYIDPGVDWVLRESLVGAGGIDVSGVNVTFRGNGWDSRMVLDHDVGASLLFTSTVASELFFYDLNFSSDDTVSAIGVGNFGAFRFYNCECQATTFTGTAIFFHVDNFAEWEWNQCHFRGAASGGPSTVRMIGPDDHISLRMSDCVAIGEFANGAVSGTAGFEIAGMTNHTSINGFVFTGNSGRVSLIIGNGRYTHIYDSFVTGFGPLDVFMSRSFSHLSNSQISGVLTSLSGFSETISNVTVITTATLYSSVKAENFNVAGVLTLPTSVLGDGNNQFSNCTFGALTFGAAPQNNNKFSNCNLGFGAPPTTVLTDFNSFSNCQFSSTVTVSGDRNKLINCIVDPGDITITGFNNQIGNCDVTTLNLSGAGNEENKVSNCNMTTSLLVDGMENNISNCDVGSTTVLGATAAATNNTISSCNLTGAVTIGGAAAVTNNTLSGNQIGGSVSIGSAGSTVGNKLIGNNIEFPAGAPTLTVGLLGGGLSQNCVINGNFVEGILTVNNSVGIMETDNCVFSGNRFLGGIAALTDSTTGSQPLFTGNIIAGGGATATVAGGHASGVTNSAP
jgi:hypothetical protein